jgi:hypothetical protein
MEESEIDDITKTRQGLKFLQNLCPTSPLSMTGKLFEKIILKAIKGMQ